MANPVPTHHAGLILTALTQCTCILPQGNKDSERPASHHETCASLISSASIAHRVCNLEDRPGELPDTMPEKPIDETQYLPGQPLIPINDTQAVISFLKQDLVPEALNKMAGRLWWMSTQSSSNISPLHHQAVKGRAIIITEKPRLHLV